MLSHSRPLSLLSLTVAYFLATSLAAPGPSTKPTSNLQLNGVPGPYFDGVEGADRAEIAGIMATLILNNGNGNTDEDSSSSSNRDDAATKSKLWLFIVVNEYKDDRLIRQSECFRDVVDGMPELHIPCIATIGAPMIEGDLDIAALQKMLKEYLTLNDSPRFKQLVERRETMNLIMDNLESGFSFALRSNSKMSERIVLGLGKDFHETKIAKDVYDFLWTPERESNRYVAPYAWSEGETLRYRLPFPPTLLPGDVH